MAVVFTKAFSFVSIIVIGFVLHRTGFFKDEDFRFLSKLVLHLTLPAAIISNFSQSTLELSTIIFFIMGMFLSAATALFGFLLPAKTNGQRAFNLMNGCAFNIGSFGLPFAQSMFGPTAVIVLGLFDAGNSMMTFGGSYGAADAVKHSGSRFPFAMIWKKLTRSVPFITYVTMTVLSLLKLRLPAPIVSTASLIGSANIFIAMLMIGVGFKVPENFSEISIIVRIIAVRYISCILLAAALFKLTPFPLECRQALAVAVLCPVSALAPMYSDQIGEDYSLASTINSISIVLSVILLVTALIFIAV